MLHYSSDEETKKRVRHGLMTHPPLDNEYQEEYYIKML